MMRALLALLLVTAGTAQAQPSAGVGHVVTVVGRVWVGPEGQAGAARLAERGREVLTGDVIRTEADGRVRLLMKDKSVLDLAGNTSVSLRNYRVDPVKKERQASLKLTFGRLWAKVSKAIASEKPNFEVQANNAVAGIRGTELFVGVEPETGEADVTVVEGHVEVTSVDAQGTAGPPVQLLAMQKASVTPTGEVKTSTVTPSQVQAMAASTSSGGASSSAGGAVGATGTTGAAGGATQDSGGSEADTSADTDVDADTDAPGADGGGAQLPNLDPGSGSAKVRARLDVRE